MTPGWLSLTSPSFLGSCSGISGWKVEFLCSAGKMTDQSITQSLQRELGKNLELKYCTHTQLFLNLVGNAHNGGPPVSPPALI